MTKKAKARLFLRICPQDDPQIRQPDITKAKNILQWEPKIDRIEGLKKTVEYFKENSAFNNARGAAVQRADVLP